MAIKLNSVGQIEHAYSFEDATVTSDVLNGTFGSVTNGVFAAAANGTKVVMQIELGDDEYMDEYTIKSGSHVRVLDLVSLAEQYSKNTKFEIYGAQLPSTFAKDDKLVSDATGKLVVDASATAPYIQITNIIGNKLGVEATFVPATA